MPDSAVSQPHRHCVQHVASCVEPADAGAASGLMNTTKQAGEALGLTVLVTVAGSHASVAAMNYGRVFWVIAAALVGVAVMTRALPATRDEGPQPPLGRRKRYTAQ